MSAATRSQRLTVQQSSCLALLAYAGADALSPDALAFVLDTSSQGAAATASSLVRRGLASRVRVDKHVRYLATNAGAALVFASDS